MNFNPGQRVVCIDVYGAPQLKLKGIYTVKEAIGPCRQHWRGMIINGYAIYLHEAEPAAHFYGFAAERFRPLQERQTNISVFTDMLIDVPVDA